MKARTVDRHVSAYRRALELLPADHTTRHGGDQARTFGDLLAGGTPAVAAWAAVIPDFALTLWRSSEPGRNTMYALARILSIALAGFLVLASIAWVVAALIADPVTWTLAAVGVVVLALGVLALAWLTGRLALPAGRERAVVIAVAAGVALASVAALTVNVSRAAETGDAFYPAIALLGVLIGFAFAIVAVQALRPAQVSPPASNG